MNAPQAQRSVLDREFLEIRAQILTLAASLDRLDRAGPQVADDPRLHQLREGVRILVSEGDGRAERVQMHFSRAYAADWRKQFEL